MKVPNKIKAAVAIIFGVILLAGCPTKTSINKINSDPGRYAGKEVTIAGKVSSGFGALGSGVYEVDDGTGSMWVYSQSYGVPGNGTKVAVTGRVEQGFNFAGRNFATILRQTQARH
ncbi:MAG TPA: hypothetical protein VFJ47_04840 [Terriglobales bacterium]|nr:hypothetical protein [Terriglobales bacterium]